METYSKQTTRRSRGDNQVLSLETQHVRLASLYAQKDVFGVSNKHQATDKQCWESSKGYFFGGETNETKTPSELGKHIIGDISIVQVLYEKESDLLHDILTKLVSAGCDTSEGYLSTFYSDDTAGGAISGGLVADAKQKGEDDFILIYTCMYTISLFQIRTLLYTSTLLPYCIYL